MEGTNDEGEGDENIDYAIRLKKYMDIYRNNTGFRNCDYGSNIPDVETEDGEEAPTPYCRFDLAKLGNCASYPYGFVADENHPFVEPCIFLKFNKIYNWVPEPIVDLTDPAYDGMSGELREKIRRSPEASEKIWIDCQGRYPADREAADFIYYPADQGIPTKYFPYRGGSYQAPLLALKIRQTHKEQHWGQLLHIECRAWYEGVVHDTKDKAGLVQFEVQLLPTDQPGDISDMYNRNAQESEEPTDSAEDEYDK